MKHLKPFNESSQVSLYSKGEVFIFPRHSYGDKMVSDKTVADCAKQLGYELDTTYHTGTEFLIKCPIGKENEAGAAFKENYPEFFSGYERRDLNMEWMSDTIDEIVNDVEDLERFVGNIKGVPLLMNKEIDAIIDKLNKLKIK